MLTTLPDLALPTTRGWLLFAGPPGSTARGSGVSGGELSGPPVAAVVQPNPNDNPPSTKPIRAKFLIRARSFRHTIVDAITFAGVTTRRNSYRPVGQAETSSRPPAVWQHADIADTAHLTGIQTAV